ncbi:helix-turn-helix transcriptional regulator [Providencia rettgeri]|nr:helix-turn-helix transcriptional regulator [Providencia rettgeri]MDK7746090.1 helix-turn-helix transcriptional regulator [Providencia rettgeri]MDK7758536.1 helix-turn-helix transcriptional regulator [Providencia rettgeri]
MTKTNILLRRDIGLFLRQARIDKSLTGYQLAEILKISQQQVSRYERGETGINVEVLNTLLIVLEKNWLEFFFKVLVNYSSEIADIRTQDELFYLIERSFFYYYGKPKKRWFSIKYIVNLIMRS